MIDIGDCDAARCVVARKSLTGESESSLAIAEHYEDADLMHGKGEIHVAIFVEVRSDHIPVIELDRPLNVRPLMPVPFAVAKKNHRRATPFAFGGSGDVRTTVAIHVGNGERIAPRSRRRQTF